MKPMEYFGAVRRVLHRVRGGRWESAHAVLSHMDPEKYRPIPVGITREGAWYWYPPAPWRPSSRTGGRRARTASPAPCGWTGETALCCCWTEADRRFPLQLFSRCSTGRTGRTAPFRGSLSWQECR